jgi:hypothetical protein
VSVVAGQGGVGRLALGARAKGGGLDVRKGEEAQPLLAEVRDAFFVLLAQDKIIGLQVVERRQLLCVLYGSLVDPRKHLKLELLVSACVSSIQSKL